MLAWVFNIHKLQGLSLEQSIINFDLRKKKSFWSGQLYTTPSRVKAYDNLYFLGEFEKTAIKVNKDALLECESLKQNCLFSTIKRNTILDDTLTILIIV